ncbi:hypothetical protein RhiirA5_409618 [Rhizophagus irregularis]|uniref:Uncharacterized protein n=1 Tax=Rhizophagus irregularis TaxID=588596 RepID=A0A2I1DX89_9GLOM|nr:hypothetical protein RhiirA5_409618 [Rhizophagus irregularis]PKY14470.1 hypothetical protein RhiirB3_426470 [Rhizophagus irregularis]
MSHRPAIYSVVQFMAQQILPSLPRKGGADDQYSEVDDYFSGLKFSALNNTDQSEILYQFRSRKTGEVPNAKYEEDIVFMICMTVHWKDDPEPPAFTGEDSRTALFFRRGLFGRFWHREHL